MLTSDLFLILLWWLLLLGLGATLFPLTSTLFKKFPDLGYPFTKTIAIITTSYVVWLFGILKILPFLIETIWLTIILLGTINLFILKSQITDIKKSLQKSWKLITFEELFFLFGLTCWSIIRAYQPDIRGLEKFMDFGFINSILKSQYFPPQDMWFAQENINYYYFGHLYTAVLTKLSNIPSDITYNLMLGTIFGLGLICSFSLVITLLRNNLRNKLRKFPRLIFIGGVTSAILLVLGGNFHTPFFVIKDGIQNYWYPDATRFIGYNPATEDKTIHEFPAYSFVVSDLHAHLLNFPFVLLYLALLWTIIQNQEKKQHKFSKQLTSYIPLGYLLGIMLATNTWDFAIYFFVTGVTLSWTNLAKYTSWADFFWENLKSLLIIAAVSTVTAIPFLYYFSPLGEGIARVQARSPLWQLAILWGFPAILTAIFTTFLRKNWKQKNLSDTFIASLLISSWILIAIPETLYVKDIYISSFHRANTMFKLTYQAYVMFYLSAGYIAIRIITTIKKPSAKNLLAVFFTALFTPLLIYPYLAIRGYYSNLQQYKGLSGKQWLSETYPNDYKALTWLKNNTQGQPVILEAVGDSYTDYNKISSYSGLPTIQGWLVHEWLWRGSFNKPGTRASEAETIYTSQDLATAKTLLEKYNVKFVIVGTHEREKYQTLNEEKFSQLGKIVFEKGGTKIYSIEEN